jgi:hypothetical protein
LRRHEFCAVILRRRWNLRLENSILLSAVWVGAVICDLKWASEALAASAIAVSKHIVLPQGAEQLIPTPATAPAGTVCSSAGIGTRPFLVWTGVPTAKDAFFAVTGAPLIGQPPTWEQVRVCDWGLSQPENKDGSAPAYRQVVNTFGFDDREIVLVRCYKEDSTIDQFGVTPNHPFLDKNVGWTRADQLGSGTELELHDGSVATTLCASPLFRTAQPGQGWATGVWGAEANDGSGALVDLGGPSFAIGADDVFNWDVLDDEHVDPRVRTRVYNLEVDEFKYLLLRGAGCVDRRRESTLTPRYLPVPAPTAPPSRPW